jgi:hypothetical protein
VVPAPPRCLRRRAIMSMLPTGLRDLSARRARSRRRRAPPLRRARPSAQTSERRAAPRPAHRGRRRRPDRAALVATSVRGRRRQGAAAARWSRPCHDLTSSRRAEPRPKPVQRPPALLPPPSTSCARAGRLGHGCRWTVPGVLPGYSERQLRRGQLPAHVQEVIAMTTSIVIAALIALFLGWVARLQRRRGGGIRPEEGGRDKGMTHLP